MRLPPQVNDWLAKNNHGETVAIEPVSGGCINDGARLNCASGATFFIKQNSEAPADMFPREAEGLRALAQADGPLVPEPYLAGDTFLLMQDLAPAPRAEGYWQSLGHQLAALHQQQSDRFGFEHTNYIGSTRQPNPWTDDGHQFFAQERLLFQAQLAQDNHLLESTEVARIEKLADRLPELVPKQPASLMHGDLWSGNAISDARGEPALIDPAAHYGWAEAELAMTTLFGRFPGAFYRAYEEVRPLARGWQERLPLYNLYHLLNHLNLFGHSYLSQVQSVLRRFQR